MAFTSVSFTGPLVADPRSFAFTSVSPTKAFIMYTGWTGPAVGQGTRKLFIQAVYFNGRNAPTYGPACAVYNLSYTGIIMPSLCVLSDGRILAVVLESATSFSYFVFDVDGSDRATYSFKSGSPIATALNGVTYAAPTVAALADGKAISSHPTGNNGSGSYANFFQLITVGATGFTLQQVNAGIAPCRSNSDTTNNPKGWVNISTTLFRKDRDGKLMAIRSMWAADYSVSSQSYSAQGYGFTSFNDQGVVQNSAGDSGLINLKLAGGHDNGGFLKGRDMLPISANSLLSLGAANSDGYASNNAAATGRNNFVKITLSGIQVDYSNNTHITATVEQSWRDTSSVVFQDVIWLDNEYFFALARVTGATPASDESQNGYTWTVAAADARDCKVYIGKYNEATGSVTIADAAPLPLPTRIAKAYCSPMLHRISNTEVAILQVCQVENVSTGIAEINITVCGA